MAPSEYSVFRAGFEPQVRAAGEEAGEEAEGAVILLWLREQSLRAAPAAVDGPVVSAPARRPLPSAAPRPYNAPARAPASLSGAAANTTAAVAAAVGAASPGSGQSVSSGSGTTPSSSPPVPTKAAQEWLTVVRWQTEGTQRADPCDSCAKRGAAIARGAERMRGDEFLPCFDRKFYSGKIMKSGGLQPCGRCKALHQQCRPLGQPPPEKKGRGGGPERKGGAEEEPGGAVLEALGG